MVERLTSSEQKAARVLITGLNVLPALKDENFFSKTSRSYPRVRTMVQTLSLGRSDVSPVDMGKAAVPTPEYPEAFGPDDSLTAANDHGPTREHFPSNRSNHDFKQEPRASAALFRSERQGLHRGERR